MRPLDEYSSVTYIGSGRFTTKNNNTKMQPEPKTGAPACVTSIVEATGFPETTLRNALKKLVTSGRVASIQDQAHRERQLFTLPNVPLHLEKEVAK